MRKTMFGKRLICPIKPSHINKTMFFLAASSVWIVASGFQQRQFVIFDGNTYRPDQFELAASSPVLRQSAYSDSNGSFVIPRAQDGHYYVNGSVNGFPVTFMIDTGASITAIPSDAVRNAGIRAGEVRTFNTAAGPAPGMVSKRNVLELGPFKLKNVEISSNPKLDSALLGMNVLGKFRLVQESNHLKISL